MRRILSRVCPTLTCTYILSSFPCIIPLKLFFRFYVHRVLCFPFIFLGFPMIRFCVHIVNQTTSVFSSPTKRNPRYSLYFVLTVFSCYQILRIPKQFETKRLILISMLLHVHLHVRLLCVFFQVRLNVC